MVSYFTLKNSNIGKTNNLKHKKQSFFIHKKNFAWFLDNDLSRAGRMNINMEHGDQYYRTILSTLPQLFLG